MPVAQSSGARGSAWTGNAPAGPRRWRRLGSAGGIAVAPAGGAAVLGGWLRAIAGSAAGGGAGGGVAEGGAAEGGVEGGIAQAPGSLGGVEELATGSQCVRRAA